MKSSRLNQSVVVLEVLQNQDLDRAAVVNVLGWGATGGWVRRGGCCTYIVRCFVRYCLVLFCYFDIAMVGNSVLKTMFYINNDKIWQAVSC